MSNDDVPHHLEGGPTIPESDFILGGFSPAEVTEIHKAVATLTTEISTSVTDSSVRYFILGNYDRKKKERLHPISRSLYTQIEHVSEVSLSIRKRGRLDNHCLISPC